MNEYYNINWINIKSESILIERRNVVSDLDKHIDTLFIVLVVVGYWMA